MAVCLKYFHLNFDPGVQISDSRSKSNVFCATGNKVCRVLCVVAAARVCIQLWLLKIIVFLI